MNVDYKLTAYQGAKCRFLCQEKPSFFARNMVFLSGQCKGTPHSRGEDFLITFFMFFPRPAERLAVIPFEAFEEVVAVSA